MRMLIYLLIITSSFIAGAGASESHNPTIIGGVIGMWALMGILGALDRRDIRA